MSIQDGVRKCNQWCDSHVGRSVLTVLIMIFVGLSAFALGRLSMQGQAAQPVELSNYTTPKSREVVTGNLVASRHSDKFHYPWCPGAQRISDENRITFSSRNEARQHGYAPARNCPGLEK